MSRYVSILAMIGVVAVVTTSRAETIVFQDNFDSYSTGPLDGKGNWTATNVEVSDNNGAGGFLSNSTPNFIALPVDALPTQATWKVDSPGLIQELTVAFFAEFQGNSDPHVAISPDGATWTDVTAEFGLTTQCDNDISAGFQANLTTQLAVARISNEVYIRWNNENPNVGSCWIIALDSVSATINATTIPAVSTWGMMALVLLLVPAGILVMTRRRPAAG